jgi:hypothetical protein
MYQLLSVSYKHSDYLGGLRKSTKNNRQGSLLLDRESKLGSPECEAEMVTPLLRHSMTWVLENCKDFC